jgi:hypothetical protein
MPTGYTDKIKDGISFEQFVMLCARGMGACVTMRDEPWDAPIPDEFKPSDYHFKKIEEAEAELARLRAMSPDEAERAAHESFKAEAEHRDKSIKEMRDLKVKYLDMLSRVREWGPPTTEHHGLKEFMVSQIRKSIDFDCNDSYYHETEVVRLSGQKWLRGEIKRINGSIEYHTEAAAKEAERARSATEWIRALRRSLEA